MHLAIPQIKCPQDDRRFQGHVTSARSVPDKRSPSMARSPFSLTLSSSSVGGSAEGSSARLFPSMFRCTSFFKCLKSKPQITISSGTGVQYIPLNGQLAAVMPLSLPYWGLDGGPQLLSAAQMPVL